VCCRYHQTGTCWPGWTRTSVEGRADAGPRGASCPPWIRTTTAESRIRCPAVGPMGIEYGRRDSNSHEPSGSPGFEPGVAAFSPRPRAPPETRTPFSRVRAGCITSHACSACIEPHAGIEPAFPAWKAGTLAVVLVRHKAIRTSRFPEGSNLTPAVLHTAALPDELENLASGWVESNHLPRAPKARRLPMTYTPCVELVGVEPTASCVQDRRSSS
jgi:hypothetical protein